MVARQDQQRVKLLLIEEITNFCKAKLTFKSEFCVEGLLGITLDNHDVVLINIKETVKSINNQNVSPNSRDPLAPLDLMVFNSVSLTDVQSTIGEDLSMKNTSLTSTPGKKHNTSICSYLDKLEAGCDAGMKGDTSLNFALNYALYDDVIEDLSMASGRRFQGLSMDDLVFDNDMGDIMVKGDIDKEVSAASATVTVDQSRPVVDKVASMKNEALNCLSAMEPMNQAETLDLSVQDVLSIATASQADSDLSGGQQLDVAMETGDVGADSASAETEMPLNLSEPKKKKTIKKKFPCSQCGKSYKTESSLNKHKCKAQQTGSSSGSGTGTETTQPLDLTVGRLDGEDEPLFLGGADIVNIMEEPLSLSGEPTNNNNKAESVHDDAETIHENFINESGEVKESEKDGQIPKKKMAPDPVKAQAGNNDQDQFVCICNKSLPDYDAYLDHMALCTKSRQTPYKSCEVCGKYLFSSSGYIKHKRIHMGAYKFWCNVCQKGFFDRTHLNAHVDSSHSKVRRYICKICDKKFYWKHHLKRHIVTCEKAQAKSSQNSSRGSSSRTSPIIDMVETDGSKPDEQDAFTFSW